MKASSGPPTVGTMRSPAWARVRFVVSWAVALGLLVVVLPRAVSISWHGVLPELRSVHWPTAVALVLLAQPILISLFQYGELGARDVAMSALSLQAYSLGLVAFMLVKVLAPGYYARKDTATPVKIGIVAMVVNMVLNIALVLPLMHYWSIGHVGLALATSLAAFLNAGLLLRGLLRDGVYRFHGGWARYTARLLVATSGMALTVVLLSRDPVDWLAWDWQRRVLEIAMVCCAGAAAYLSIHLLLGTRLRHLRRPSAL